MERTDLGENHGGDLLRREGVGAAEVLDLDLGVAVVINDLEGPRLHVLLDGGVVEAAADQTPGGQRGSANGRTQEQQQQQRSREGLVLDIKDGVDRVHGGLVLGRLTNEALLLGEGDERGGGEATLLVGDDLDIGTLVRGNARVGGAWTSRRWSAMTPNFGQRKAQAGEGRAALRRGSTVGTQSLGRTGSITEIDANGTIVDFVRHFEDWC